MEEDFYKVLGVERTAAPADIQKAYRTLARKYHPDVNPDDKSAKEKFQKLQRAYEVLSDPKKREMYDRFGSNFEQAGAGPGGGGWTGQVPPGFQGFDFTQFFGGGESPFGDIFSGGGRRARGGRAPRRGQDLEHQLEVPFRTAISGGDAVLRIDRGQGRLETLNVKIPAGIDDGQKIRLRGQGESGPRGVQPGDLLIEIRVSPHPFYRRRGADLEVTVPVTVSEAALGTKVELPTPSGTLALTIPPGTSSGRRLRVKGHGVAGKSGAGDLYAEVQIVLPPNVDDQGRDLLRRFDEQFPSKPRADLRW